ncbi:MAG: hypothetical protein QM775_10010 [Pirellulales bacterium]
MRKESRPRIAALALRDFREGLTEGDVVMACRRLWSFLAKFATAASLQSAALAMAGESAASPFADLKRSPFAAESSEPSANELVDLTKPQSDDDVRLTDGAEFFDTGLVASNGRLLGLFAHSDYAFRDFVTPVSNPLFFEDPRTLTELRIHFANQWIPGSNPVFQGGNAQFLAAQIRVALTERLSVIATKDGYIWLNPGNPGLAGSDGFADIAAGLKYNLIRRPESQFLYSVGATFELDVGSHRVFQGLGDGEFHLFNSTGKEFFGGLAHWISGSGLRLPADSNTRSTMVYWSNQWDVKMTDNFYVVGGVNWFHWLEAGNNLPVNFEGMDLFNLGSTGVEGNDVVTSSLGLRYRFGCMNETGITWEVPVTDRRDLLESRLYVDLAIRF